MLLGAYEERPDLHLRLLHSRSSSCSARSNHFVTVGHPRTSTWRESSFRDLPLLGDGLLTVDDDYHDRARAIMMPAFHREQIVAASMTTEADLAISPLALGQTSRHLRLDAQPGDGSCWRCSRAGRALRARARLYGIDFQLPLLRGPGSPWRRMTASRKVLDEIVFGEISRRRANPDSHGQDLVGARGEGGEAFSDREIRDQVMTLMFAGHDTSTSTLTFMLHELARHPEALAKLHEEQERVLGATEVPSVDQLERDPTTRHGARRGAAPLPARLDRPRVRVWRLHRAQGRLRQLLLMGQPPHPRGFPDPEAFVPERFTRERRPRAYVPFGGGSRSASASASARPR